MSILSYKLYVDFYEELVDQYKKSQNQLCIIMSSAYSLYLDTQGVHWCSITPNFYSVHKLSEMLYKFLADNIDEIAERIRAIGYLPPTTFKDIENLSCFKPSPIEVLQDPIERMSVHWSEFVKLLEESMSKIDHSDEGTKTLLGDLIKAHQKNHWLLRSHLSDKNNK